MKFDIIEIANTIAANDIEYAKTKTKSGMIKVEPTKPSEWKRLHKNKLQGLSSRKKSEAYQIYANECGKALDEHSDNFIKRIGMTVKCIKEMPNGDVVKVYRGETITKTDRQALRISERTGITMDEARDLLALA